MDRHSFLNENGSTYFFHKKAEYIGSFLVTGNTHNERAEIVRLKLEAARAYTQSKPILLVISLHGIKVCDENGLSVHMAHALRRISYATCDMQCGQFAFLAREPKAQPNIQYGHAFVTKTSEEAIELNSIVGEAFRVAYANQCLTTMNDSSAVQAHKLTNSMQNPSNSPPNPVLNEKNSEGIRIDSKPNKSDQGYSMDSGLSSSESGNRIPKSQSIFCGKVLHHSHDPDEPVLSVESESIVSRSFGKMNIGNSATSPPTTIGDQNQEHDTPTPLCEEKLSKRAKVHKRIHQNHHHQHRQRNAHKDEATAVLRSDRAPPKADTPITDIGPSNQILCNACHLPATSRADNQPCEKNVQSNSGSSNFQESAQPVISPPNNFNLRSSIAERSPVHKNTYDQASSKTGRSEVIKLLQKKLSDSSPVQHLNPVCDNDPVCQRKPLTTRVVCFSEGKSNLVMVSDSIDSRSTFGSDSSGFSTNPCVSCSSESSVTGGLASPVHTKSLYAMDASELASSPWYQPSIPREIALEMLARRTVGSFIVRDSGTHPNSYALSIRGVERNDLGFSAQNSPCSPTQNQFLGINHYLIQRTPNGVRLKGLDKEWPSLSCLILHLTVMPEMLPCPLRMTHSTSNLTFLPTESTETPRPHSTFEQIPDLSLMNEAISSGCCFRPISSLASDGIPSRVTPLSARSRHTVLSDDDEDYHRLSDFSSILADLQALPIKPPSRSRRQH